jgi:hypothetical protein
MSDLFISHSSADSAAAREIERRLASHGHRSVFLDFDPELGIAAGQNWERTLYTRLRVCRAVIVLCSDRYLASHWCFAEVALARMTGKHLFTLLIDGLNDATTLPSMLTEQQCIDFRQDPEGGLRRLWRGLRDKGIEKSEARDWNPRDPPYPGLLAFDEGDAAIYFAREHYTDEGIELLNRAHRYGRPRLALLLGASGSGKSSLLRAGLLPRLRRDTSQWIVLDPFRPGIDPLRELSGALARGLRQYGSEFTREAIETRLNAEGGVGLLALANELRLSGPHSGGKVLLSVDQFEELLGHADPAHPANRFIQVVAGALAGDDATLVGIAAMRSDYLDAFQHLPDFANVEFHSLSLGPLSETGLREIIERPAELGAIELERGLSDALLRDTGAADALPLLAFTLRLLWDRHHRTGRITVHDYETMGRLQGAVAAEADRVLEVALRLGPEAELRAALLSMARITEDGTGFARQAVRWDELTAAVQTMLRLFVDHRLLTMRGDGSVEVAHEALFRSWRCLADWLAEDREFMLWHLRVDGAMAEWQRTGEDQGALLHGRVLDEALRWATQRQQALSSAERRFIDTSVAVREAEQLEQQQARERERAQQAALVEAERRNAEQQDRARRTLRRSRMLMVAAAFAAAVLVLVVGRFFYTLDRPVRALAFSADGRTLAVANEDLKVNFWDVTTGKSAAETLTGDPSRTGSWVAAAFSPDRRWLIATSTFSSGGVLWDLDKHSEERWSTGQSGVITRLAFSPDGTLVAAASEDRTVAIWNLRQQRLHLPLLTPSQGAIQAIAFSADGTRLATGGADRTVLLWDVATGRRASELPKDHEDSVSALAFSGDGHWLASGGHDARVRLRDLRAGRSTGAAPLTKYRVEELLFSPDSTQLAAAVYVMRKLFLWRVSDEGLTGEPIEMPEQPAQFAFSPDGKLLAVGTERGLVELWDMTTRRPTGMSLE